MNPLAVIGRVFLNFLASVGDLTLFGGRAIVHGVSGPYYPRIIARQMVDIGYYSLPVVGLTAIFTGMVLALQSYTGFSRFEARERGRDDRGAVDDARARAGARRPDGRRPGRRLDGGRDRHHARHRADRRADHAVDRPVQIPGLAAPDRRAC